MSVFIGFQDIAIGSKVNFGNSNQSKFKMKDKLVEAGRQTIFAGVRPEVGSHLKNGAPRVGFSEEPGDFAATKFIMYKTRETFEDKTYSTSTLIKGPPPDPEPVKQLSDSRMAAIYA